ncbi:MAG TPA: hypothetical protein VES20_16780, partial [Bryobacteraceae bacterium]|nr:hypothetical protein [Bryobacteraceae bacterium]
MTKKKKIWIGVAAGTAITVVGGLAIAASVLSRRFEPFIREQAVEYLSQRFEADVRLQELKIRVPKASPLKMVMSKGAGTSVRVEGAGISMRRKGAVDAQPLFTIGRFSFEVDLGTLWERKPLVRHVILDNMEIRVPPKGQRSVTPDPAPGSSGAPDGPAVRIEDVLIRNATLMVLPRDPARKPLTFPIRQLQLRSEGPAGAAMSYDAALRNPKPPG